MVKAKFSRVGIQDYYVGEFDRNELPPRLQSAPPTQLVKLLRPRSEVFKVDSIASMQGKPVTNDHPTVLVDASNYKSLAIGHALHDLAPEQDLYVAGSLVVTDQSSIEQINAGKNQISVGYLSNIKWSDSIETDPEFGLFDGVQTDIFGNHHAVVAQGRAGAEVRLADSKQKPLFRILGSRIF